MKKMVALLPIKAHSERVSGKNFRCLCNNPLYQWILENLLRSNRITRVVIDTDSEEFIEQLHRDYPSVQTILRPMEIRGGMISMNKVIAHDISTCTDSEFFFQTHTTNPLLSLKSINDAIETFFDCCEQYDSLFSVDRIQARTYWKDGSAINHVLGELKRTQDLEPVFVENSNFFIFSRTSFFRTQSRIGERPYLFELPVMESLEIDEEDDFRFVDLVMRAIHNEQTICGENVNGTV